MFMHRHVLCLYAVYMQHKSRLHVLIIFDSCFVNIQVPAKIMPACGRPSH